MRLSCVVPALNEQGGIGPCLERIISGGAEAVVVDGGSSDGTVDEALRYTPHVIVTRPGRGGQQAGGARAATGDTLCFVHADTLLPPDFAGHIHRTLALPDTVCGAFRLGIEPPLAKYRAVCLWANWRTRLFSLPYGDQALFMPAWTYRAVGGFRGIPLMEDVDLVRRLSRLGRVRLARAAVSTSSRRWDRLGVVRVSAKNLAAMYRYNRGTCPEDLAREYGR
ncbi:MAG: TIGR04283 family arsenosugar biosynthesis glycosyltransferase [Desulfatibacillaceae bacterium]